MNERQLLDKAITILICAMAFDEALQSGASNADLDNLRRTRAHDPDALERMLGQLGDVPAWIGREDHQEFLRGFEASAGRPVPPEVLSRAGERVLRRQERRARLRQRS